MLEEWDRFIDWISKDFLCLLSVRSFDQELREPKFLPPLPPYLPQISQLWALMSRAESIERFWASKFDDFNLGKVQTN